MAYPVKTTTFVSGTTISASQVNQNFDDIFNGVSDGSKDINVNAITAAAAIDANGAMTVAGAFTASGTARFSGAITASAAVYAMGTLQCNSTASFAGAVYNESTMRVSGGTTFSGSVAADGTLQCNSTARFSGAVTASAAVYATDTLRVGGGATFSGAMYADSTLRCTGNSTFSGAMYVGGDINNVGSTNPVGYTSYSVNGFNTATASVILYVRRTGKHRTVMFEMASASGVSDVCDITVPDAAAALMVNGFSNPFYCVNASSYSIGYATINNSSNTITFRQNAAGTAWTNGTTRQIRGQLDYEVA